LQVADYQNDTVVLSACIYWCTVP